VRRFAKVIIHLFSLSSEWAARLARHAWKHWLYALNLEELPEGMAWTILWQEPWSYHCARGRGIIRSLDLTLLLWIVRISQWY
jgi:hypothetical protein